MRKGLSHLVPAGRLIVGLLALGAVLGLASCNYGLRGGGLPSHINTVFVEPFENETERFDLEQELVRLLNEELPSQLGLRLAGAEVADAIVRGSVTRYDDAAQNYSSGTSGNISVLQHEVRITVSIEIIDRTRNEIIWDSQGLSGRGTYRPDTQTDVVARDLAFESLIQQIVDGALSNW